MKLPEKKSVLIGIILCTAVFVRIWGLDYDLPYIYHPDEPHNVIVIQNMFKWSDFNPHFFNYPSLFFYINAAAYIPYFLVGKCLGIFATRSDILYPMSLAMGVTKSSMPSTIVLGRMVTVVFGVGAVGMTYAIGKQLTGKAAIGLLAALLVAVSPTNVSQSRLITPNMFVIFFATAAFFAAVLVYQQGKTWQYIVAGLCVGLTASSKYNGGLIVVSLLLAHCLRRGQVDLKGRNLYLALFAGGFGFLATTPYVLLDFSKFIADVNFERQHYATGHVGMEGNVLGWYFSYLWDNEGILCALAVLEIVRGIYSRSKEIILLSLFPLVYFAFICSFAVRNEQTILPLTPFLCLLAASSVVHLLSKAKLMQSRALRQLSICAVVCLFVAGAVLSISKVIARTNRLTDVDSRRAARDWISNNVPPGSSIAIESYAPFLEPEKYEVQGQQRMIDHEPEWYLEQGCDYLVFSQGMYGRYFHDPERHATEVAKYEAFFNRFTLTKAFREGGIEIRLYATESTPRR